MQLTKIHFIGRQYVFYALIFKKKVLLNYLKISYKKKRTINLPIVLIMSLLSVFYE